MISCPFDVPKFEYHSAVPRIQKCTMCWERLSRGEQPACVENCPAEALTFGRATSSWRWPVAASTGIRATTSLTSTASTKREARAGSTSPRFRSRSSDFPTHLDNTSYPELTRDFLTAVPVVLTVWPAFLLALRRAKVGEETAASPPVEG